MYSTVSAYCVVYGGWEVSSVIKCQKCGGYIILSYNSLFPPMTDGLKPCKCNMLKIKDSK